MNSENVQRDDGRRLLCPDEVRLKKNSFGAKAPDRKPEKRRFRLSEWKTEVQYIFREARSLSIMLRHPLVPWRAKIAAGLAVGYFFSPIQLIPSFIPVIGQLDDVCVMLLAMKLVRRWTPPDVVAECEDRAATPLTLKPWVRGRAWKVQRSA